MEEVELVDVQLIDHFARYFVTLLCHLIVSFLQHSDRLCYFALEDTDLLL